MSEREKVFGDAHDVVALLDDGMTVGTFLINRERLETQCGFPLPCPAFQRPKRWRLAAVRAWIDAQGYTMDEINAATVGPGAEGNVVRLRMARA